MKLNTSKCLNLNWIAFYGEESFFHQMKINLNVKRQRTNTLIDVGHKRKRNCSGKRHLPWSCNLWNWICLCGVHIQICIEIWYVCIFALHFNKGESLQIIHIRLWRSTSRKQWNEVYVKPQFKLTDFATR